jgi:hypothetical protein
MNKFLFFSLLLLPSALCGFIGANVSFFLKKNNLDYSKLITLLVSLAPPLILAVFIFIPEYTSNFNDAPMRIIGMVIGGVITSFTSFTIYELTERFLDNNLH